MTEEAADYASRWGPFLPSLSAALAIFAWRVATNVLGQALEAVGGPFSLDLFFQNLAYVTVITLALSLAVLFSFWLVAPITGRLRLTRVIVRAVVAAGIAVLLVWPVQFGEYVLAFAQTGQSNGAQGNLYVLATSYLTPPELLGITTTSAIETSVFAIPTIIIAALGSWAWQRRSIHGQA